MIGVVDRGNVEGEGLNHDFPVGVEYVDELLDCLRGGDLEFNSVSARESDVDEVDVDLAVAEGVGYRSQGEGDGAVFG